MNAVFINLETSIEECEKVIKAFENRGYETYFDTKVRVLLTKAPLTKIKEVARLFKCIQSYSIGPENYNPKAQ